MRLALGGLKAEVGHGQGGPDPVIEEGIPMLRKVSKAIIGSVMMLSLLTVMPQAAYANDKPPAASSMIWINPDLERQIIIRPTLDFSSVIAVYLRNRCDSTLYDVPVTQLTQSQAEKAVLCLTNEHRAQNGVGSLTVDTALGNAARGHAQALVTQRWWVNGANPHVNPATGSTPLVRVRQAGFCSGSPTQVAENAHWSSPNPTPRSAVTSWMNSSGHRANILNASLQRLGVGIALGAPRPGTYPNAATFIQNFGTC